MACINQNSLGSSISFKSIKGSWSQMFEKHYYGDCLNSSQILNIVNLLYTNEEQPVKLALVVLKQVFVKVLYPAGSWSSVSCFPKLWPWLNLLWFENLFVCPSLVYWSLFYLLSWLQCYQGFWKKILLVPKQA